VLSGDVLCLARSKEWLAVGGDGRLPNAGLADPEFQVLLTSLNNGQHIPLIGGHDDVITHVALHNNGHWLASASADGKIRCWSLSDGTASPRRVKDQHERAVNALAFHPSDDWLFSAADDGTVVLWDLQTGQSSLVLDQFNGSALHLVVSADGRWLFTSGEDGTVRGIDLARCWLIKKACAELKKQPLPPPKPASTVRA
jgi:WD40 repeat protein